MKKLVLFLIVLLGSVVGVIQFNTGKIVFYENKATEIFYKNYLLNIENNTTSKSKFTVRIKSIDRTQYNIYLGIYSKHKDYSVFIKNIELDNKVIDINKEIHLEKLLINKSIYYHTLKLFTINNEELEKLTIDDDYFYIDLKYILADQEKSKLFKIEKIIKKYVVFPT